jgi:hypothetical protein
MFHTAGDAVDDDTMQDNMPASNGHAADEHMQDQEGQQQQEEHDSKQEQDGQASKARKGKLCDLTQPSKRVRLSCCWCKVPVHLAAATGQCLYYLVQVTLSARQQLPFLTAITDFFLCEAWGACTSESA